jgi:serine/threonine-protein kinase
MNPSPPRPGLTGPTIAYRTDSALPSGPPPPRCRIAAGSGATGSQFYGEIETLLRARLRLVTLLLLAPTLFFLVKNHIEVDLSLLPANTSFCFHTTVTMILVAMAALVWLRPCLVLHKLRAVELIVFGTMGVFFAWMQYRAFHDETIYRLAEGPNELIILRFVAGASSLRWFFLIVLYGVFIPNNWRRCATVVAGMAVTAVAITAFAAAQRGRLDAELISAIADMVGLLLTGAAVAVFGSYRLNFLQRQAFAAQQLGQYRLKKRLGAGGMGEVFLAEHTLLRRPCAIKLIRPEQTADPTSLQRFEREVRAMATLTHWNTVEVFDYGHADDGTFYYVMEYLPGQNLETLVARYGPQPAGRVIHLLRQVCRALREAHGVGLLHRDIKPSNIITCQRGGVADVVKLVDFGLVQDAGLSAETDKLTVKGTILGSPPYMSPEQAAGKAGLDARSDIYSVGGVAYFLLTGRPPFQKETPLEMLLAHAYETPVPPADVQPDVPLDLQAVILRCLFKNPGDRYPDADSLEKALAQCAAANDWMEETAAAWWRDRAAGGADTNSLDEVATQISAPV